MRGASIETPGAARAWSAARLLGPAAVALLVALVLAGGTARAQVQLISAEPADGAVLQEPPQFIALCFSEPVRIDQSSDWRFSLKTPDGIALGLRIEFKQDGSCVDVEPGYPDDPPNGIWELDWLVTAQSDGSQASGKIRFQLGELREGETPVPTAASSDAVVEENDEGTPTAAYVAVIAAVAVVVVAGVGYAALRLRR
jgi:methionine-rich copper-binding protein CopC